tara:strand:+ start:211 stop:546 length:336 start_codon:yes stop_codon:yes gene_type:complete
MQNSKFIIQSDSTILQAIDKISNNSYRTVIVLNKNKVLGVISEGDILKSILKNIDLKANIKISMNKSFKFVKIGQEEKAKEIFKKHLVGIVPVLNDKMQLKKILKITSIFR